MKAVAKARWYVRRLAAMSAPELLHRGREKFRRTTGKHVMRRFWRPDFCDAPLPVLPGLRARLLAWDPPPELLQAWRSQADSAQTGAMVLLGQLWPPLPLDQRWHLDPVTGRHWPARAYCHDIDFRHQQALGDVKFVWELGRLQYLQPVAALACRNADARLAQLCAAHVESWIDNNAFATGTGWASGIELALRVVSLLVVATLAGEHFSTAQRVKLWGTLQAHGVWLERFPSLYSSANNHRIAEGLGLYLLGTLCPRLPRAGSWREQGWTVLCDAAQQQILPDGVGAEQSIAYTGVVLEMLLLGLAVARAQGEPVPRHYPAQLARAAAWLRWCTDAGGNQPRIGDDDNARVIGAYRADEAHTSSVLAAAAALLDQPSLTPPVWRPDLRHAMFGLPPQPAAAPQGLRVFAAGGYSVMRHQVAGRDLLAVLDHGDLGYLSIAAHGHADSLSLWLHLDGQPIFADAGTFLYHAGGAWRRHFRGTAAHNTLRLEAADSSIQAGAFNWSQKAAARLAAVRTEPDLWVVEAEHTGYRRRFGAVHRRRIALSLADGEFSIADRVEAARPLRAELNFLLFPGLRAHMADGAVVILRADGGPLLRLSATGPLLPEIVGPETPGGWYSPEFNIKHPATRLCWRGTLHPDEAQCTQIQLVPERIGGGADPAIPNPQFLSVALAGDQ